jgi:uracil-DNA glycosylase
MKLPWEHLKFWNSGEWQVCDERLKEMAKAGVWFNPERKDLFRALHRCSLDDTRVCIIGQDPYPQRVFATGMAFSIPAQFGRDSFPPTLNTIFKEYTSDLGYPFPDTGDLSGWASQGVLLWNAIPTCKSGQSLSHDWEEWSWLTKEIVEQLSEKGSVFAFLGAVAKRFLQYVDLTRNEVILTSHPSPRAGRFSKTPFEGSRLFSTINDKLISQGLKPINWRLHATTSKDGLPRTSVDRGTLLPNITGAVLGGLKGNTASGTTTST